MAEQTGTDHVPSPDEMIVRFFEPVSVNMTPRDWFAIVALMWMCGREGQRGDFKRMASDAYEIADAMIMVRRGRP